MSQSTEQPVQHQLDAKGLFCPEPVMMLHNMINDIAIGERVEVLATDPSTQRDFLRFCSFLGQELEISEELADGSYRFVICKLSDSE